MNKQTMNELSEQTINDEQIPEEIIVEYKLHDLANADGSVYIEANRGMYRLPQSGLIANELLEERLNKHRGIGRAN
jgi:hypothetical protein